MNTMKLSEIQAAMDAAFTAALAKPARVAPAAIAENATLRTDLYSGKNGVGFVVTAVVSLNWRKLVIARNHGPEAHREQPAPALEALDKECQAARAQRYEAEASVYDLADAETKLASTDPAVQAAGAAQKAAALERRLQIKADLPKPE